MSIAKPPAESDRKPSLDDKLREDLQEQISSFVKLHQQRHDKNFRTNVLLVTGGITLALGVTAAGFFKQGVLAGILGLLITGFLAAQNAFYFNEKAEFQRLLFTEGENLLNILHYRVKTQSDFDVVLDAFMALKKHAAAKLPRGKGMDVVKELYGTDPRGLT